MRFNIIIQKIRFATLLALLGLIALPAGAQTQREKRVRQLFDVVLQVIDESGAPIPNASIVVGEGITHTSTDANGSVSFRGYPEDIVTITAPYYEKNVSVILDVVNAKTVTLLHARMHATSDDDLPLPFNTVKRRYHTGQDIKIDGSYFAHYPSTDIRNSMSGISSTLRVREMDGSPGLSPLEGLQQYSGLSNSYGATDKFSGMPLVMIDNVPADLQEYPIDPAMIESATLVKGILATNMYSPAATGGVLYITTKRGASNERMLHIDIENGISVIDRMPGYATGPEYAALNNTARFNDDLSEKYSSAAIAAYRNNDGYDLQYPNANYGDLMLKNTMAFRRVNMSSSGGNDIVQYYSYLGYAGEGDIYKIGAKSDYNRIIANQNVNVKVNDDIAVAFSFYGNLTFRRSPNYGFDSDYTSEGTGNATLGVIEMPAVLESIRETPPVEFPIWAYFDTASNTPWYGVTPNYTQNPVGNLVDQGFYTDRGRTGGSTFNLTWDLGRIIPGLKSTTYLGFNIHNTVRIGKANDYLAYTVAVDPETLVTTLTKSSSHTQRQMSDLYKLMDYYYQRFAFNERLSYDKAFDNGMLSTSLTFNGTLTYLNGIEEPQRQQNNVLSGTYSFMDKYSLQAVLNYAGTSSFDDDYRWGFFPAVGASWVISDEDFMPELGFLDYLKLRVQGGMVGNETYFPNLYYVDRFTSTSSTSTTTIWGFGPYTTNPWFGTTQDLGVTRAYLSRTGNPIVTWEKRKEINAGFDAVMFNNKLDLQMTYCYYVNDGAIVQVSNSLPLLAGYNGARPHYNFTVTKTNAFRTDLIYSEKIGDFQFSIGGNASAPVQKREKYDEPNYRFDYQKRTGKVSDAIFGQTYIGKFATDAEALLIPQLWDDELHAGDLKYKDMNDDGVVDDNDQSMIGHSSPRLFYGLHVMLKYKNFDLFILGNGNAFYDLPLTNDYFWNGWGDNNYSDFVKDNVGEAYPRLTYYKVNNNFITSDFWLVKGDYFKIQNVELSYTIPAKMLTFMGGRAIRIYARGSNLLTISKVKDVDPESINSGVTVYPLFKTFSGGVKFNF